MWLMHSPAEGKLLAIMCKISVQKCKQKSRRKTSTEHTQWSSCGFHKSKSPPHHIRKYHMLGRTLWTTVKINSDSSKATKSIYITFICWVSNTFVWMWLPRSDSASTHPLCTHLRTYILYFVQLVLHIMFYCYLKYSVHYSISIYQALSQMWRKHATH